MKKPNLMKFPLVGSAIAALLDERARKSDIHIGPIHHKATDKYAVLEMGLTREEKTRDLIIPAEVRDHRALAGVLRTFDHINHNLK